MKGYTTNNTQPSLSETQNNTAEKTDSEPDSKLSFQIVGTTHRKSKQTEEKCPLFQCNLITQCQRRPLLFSMDLKGGTQICFTLLTY